MGYPDAFGPAERAELGERIERSGEFDGTELLLGIQVDGRLAGEVQARQPRMGLPPGVFEIGIDLFDVADRGHGVGGEALTQLVTRLFGDEGAHRVQLTTDVDNEAMRAVSARLGFRFEGVMRSFMPSADGPRDYAIYAMTKDDFDEARERGSQQADDQVAGGAGGCASAGDGEEPPDDRAGARAVRAPLRPGGRDLSAAAPDRRDAEDGARPGRSGARPDPQGVRAGAGCRRADLAGDRRGARPGRPGGGDADGRVRLDGASAAGAARGRLGCVEDLEGCRSHARRRPVGARRGPRAPARHRPEPRGEVPGAGAVRTRPDRAGPARQARPGHRPRRGDPPDDPGPVASDEEQPGPDRGARRGQDGDRRGTRAAHRGRRRPRVAQEQARGRARSGLDDRRLEVPRRVRGPAEGGPERDRRLRGRDHHVHRRAPHDRRRRRRRGRHGRRQHAQADVGARRAAGDRRHHARRVPPAHREGPGARASVPARAGRGAERRGHHRDPAGPEGEVRGPSRRPDPGSGVGGGRRPVGPLRHGTLPSRQGDRPDRRVGVASADRDRLDADRDRRGDAAHPAARDRTGRAPEGDRRRLEAAAGALGEGAGRPARAGRGHDRALAAGEGAHREDPRAQGADRRGPERVRPRRARRRPGARGRAAVRPARSSWRSSWQTRTAGSRSSNPS